MYLSHFPCLDRPPRSRNPSPIPPSFSPSPKISAAKLRLPIRMKSHQRVLLPGSAGRQRVGRGNLPAPGCCKAAGCSTAENGGRRWGGLPAGVGVSSVSQIFSPRRLAELLLAASIYALFIETNVKTFYKYGRGLFQSCRCGVGTIFGQGLPSVPLPRLLAGQPWACVGAPHHHRGTRASSSPADAAGVAGEPERCLAGWEPATGR